MSISPNININDSEGNNNSIVIKVTYGDIDFLLTGDLESEGEKRLIDNNTDIKSEILKVGHHGSKSSSSQEFLEKIKPEISIISVGKNSYGHPNQDVLDRLNIIKSKIFRTDESGSIEINTDGKTYSVRTEK